MAKLSSIQKNLFRQKLIQKYKSKRELLKSKIKNKNISLEERINYQNKLNDLPRNGSAIRHRNRCEITGRPRGNYRKFGLSRIKLRELSMSGDLPELLSQVGRRILWLLMIHFQICLQELKTPIKQKSIYIMSQIKIKY